MNSTLKQLRDGDMSEMTIVDLSGIYREYNECVFNWSNSQKNFLTKVFQYRKIMSEKFEQHMQLFGDNNIVDQQRSSSLIFMQSLMVNDFLMTFIKMKNIVI